MKKSILIGAIAALMLFAFVACDNSGATVESKVITQIEVTSEVPSLFKGEDLSASDITVVATALDGSTFTVPAADLDVDVDTEATTVKADSGEATKIGTVTYKGFSYGSTAPVTADVKAYVYTMDNIKVTGPATPATFYVVKPSTEIEFHTEFDPAAYVVTAEAIDDEDSSLVLFSRELVYSETAAESEYSVAIAKDDANLTAGAGKITFTANTAFGTVSGKDVAIICQVDRVVSATLEAKDDVKFIAGDAAATYANGTYFDVAVTYASGYSEELTSGYTIAFDNSGLVGANLPAVGAAASASATITGTTVKTNTEVVNTSANYITSYTASYKESKTVKEGEKVVKENVEIKPVWKVESLKPATFNPTFTISDNDGTMPSIAVGEKYVFTVTLTNVEAADAEPNYALLTVPCGASTTAADPE